MRKQFGFTLIELMMTIVIIGVLAAIAIPSYERYTVKNAEEEARAQLGQLEIQLANWRASALSYRGFMPIRDADGNGNPTYGYDTSGSATNVLFVPLGSNASNHRYMIEIFDAGTSGSLVTTGSDIDVTTGRSWAMIAYPHARFLNKGAKTIAVASNGQRCQSVNQGSISVAGMIENASAPSCSGNGVEKW